MKLKLSNKHIAILMPIVALMFVMCSGSKKIDSKKDAINETHELMTVSYNGISFK